MHEQFGALTKTREVRPDAYDFGLQPLRGSLRRLDEAFAALFRRVKAGETPGYPRFKSWRRFNTAMWDQPCCWKVDLHRRGPRHQGRRGDPTAEVRAASAAPVTARGGQMRTLTVTRRKAGTGWLAAARVDIVEWQRQRATKRKYSRAWKQLNRQIARRHAKVARRADNWARDTANRLVAGYDVVVLEDRNLVAMTRSAPGTIQAPGTNVSAKAGLNRSLQDAALGRLAHWVSVKAESARRRVWLVDPRHTSQRRSFCGHTDAANRPDQATFACTGCGYEANADINAANVAQLGQAAEQAWEKAGRPSLKRPKPRMRRGITDKPKVAAAA